MRLNEIYTNAAKNIATEIAIALFATAVFVENWFAARSRR